MFFMRTTALLLMYIFISNFSMAGSRPDTFSISVTVKNMRDEPLQSAVVTLHHAKDSSIVKTELTDNAGMAVLTRIMAGQYFFEISFIGHRSDTTSIFTIGDEVAKSISIRLAPQSDNLKEVVVRATKPFVQFD